MALGEQKLQGALADLKALSHDGSDELQRVGCNCDCKECKWERKNNVSHKCYCKDCVKSDQ